ncbi:Tripartite tricarboxylate transporter family receptor [compost metagenome]
MNGWYGVFAPANTPTEIVQRLNQEINRILATDDVIQKFALQNMAKPPIKSVEQFATTVKQDVAIWQNLAKVAKLRVD